MSETEIKEEEVLAEAPNVVTKDAEKAEPTHLENDAEDLGPAVVKPTDKNPDSTKKVKKHSDQRKRYQKYLTKITKMLMMVLYRTTTSRLPLLKK